MKLFKNLFITSEEKAKKYSTLRKVLFSLIMICLLSSALITATTALFSGEKEVETHIVTGNLNFDFERVNLSGEAINEKGFLDDFNDDTLVDLKASGANAFDITEMVPGATYTGDFVLRNTGTTAFDANISFINLEHTSAYLLEQIQITFELDGNSNTYSLATYSSVVLDLGVLAADTEVEFSITINLPAAANNDAQDSSVNFDLRLVATQVLYEN